MSAICRHGLEEDWCSLCKNRLQTVTGAIAKPPAGGAWKRQFTIGEAVVNRTARTRALTGSSADRIKGTGGANLWEGTLPGTTFEITFEVWDHGTRQVGFCFVQGPLKFIGLHHRHYLMVYRTRRGSWVSLHYQTRFSPEAPDHPTKRTPNLRELAEGGRVDDPVNLLLELGATGVGEGRHVLGVSAKRPGDLCVMFDHDTEAVPVGVFVLSRVLPLWYEYEGPPSSLDNRSRTA